MMNKDFEAELALRTDIINRAIEELLPSEEGPQSTILRACGYSVRNGGKRMRPLFMQSVYRLLGGSEEEKLYLRLLLVTDYVCGMTDSYAKRLYQEMNGMF